MLSKTLTTAALSVVLFSSPGLAPAAQAGDLAFHFGGEFRLGGVSFHLGVLARDHHYHDHYYRTSYALRYEGYSCSRACYRHDGHAFHHRSCPLVRRHFELARVDARDVYDRWAPRWDDRYGRHHDDYRYDDRRYDDRRYDNRSDRRYHRRDSDRHRDRRSCDRDRH